MSLALESKSWKGRSADSEDRAFISKSSTEDFWVTLHCPWRIFCRHGILYWSGVPLPSPGKQVRGKQMWKYFLSFKLLLTLQSPLWYYLFSSHFILDLTVWWVWSFLTNWCWLLVGKYSQPKHNSWGMVEYFIAGKWNARILLSPPCVWSLRGEKGTNWKARSHWQSLGLDANPHADRYQQT